MSKFFYLLKDILPARHFHCLNFALFMGLAGCQEAPKEAKAVSDPVLQPVPFNEVILEDDFWRPRLETQINTLVPFALEKTEPAVENLEKTARYLRGDTTNLPFPHRYISSDLYKVMEGAAYLLMINRDTALERRMDEIIDIIAAAQQEDGYLYVAHITGVSKDHPHWGGGGMGDRPYSHVVHSHELYNMGHMYEAAIAYFRATGKDKWLRVSEKNARHINRVFFEGDPNYNGGKPVRQAPGHQEIELALAKLYRVTGDSLYLNMAEKFLDIRGVTYQPEGDRYMSSTYAQQHLPVTEQMEAVGHAVRAAYQYSGMAEVDALKGTHKFAEALDHIWHNIVDTKMHITGGLGAMHGIEGFGLSYELPNKEAYNETCAAVGNVLFNFRMYLLTRDASFMDVAETALYNNVLAGVNLDGNRFFYVNPLESDGEYPFNHGSAGRSPWFETACCPSNLARLIPQVPGMIYSHSADTIYVALYAGSQTTIALPQGKVTIAQKTGYPFDGRVRLEINTEKPLRFNLKLRIPTWTGDQFVPGELYHYVSGDTANWAITVNGEAAPQRMEKGFAILERKWLEGDNIELKLPMVVRFNRSIDSVAANRNRLAITRGPLVYTAEGVDNAFPPAEYELRNVPEAGAIQIQRIEDGVLKGIPQLRLPATRTGNIEEQETLLTMVPYYAWNNRGVYPMQVWIAAD